MFWSPSLGFWPVFRFGLVLAVTRVGRPVGCDEGGGAAGLVRVRVVSVVGGGAALACGLVPVDEMGAIFRPRA